MDFYYISDDDSDQMDEIVDDVTDDAEEDQGLLDSAAFIQPPQKIYRSLKEEDIKKLQQKDISDVCNVLSVSRSVACTLLCQNNWTPTTVYDTWFERPVFELKKQGNKSQNEICNICFETTRKGNTVIIETLSAGCGHLFCVYCWTTYISVSIESGPGCLTLTCPEPGCEFNPGVDMVDLVSSQDDKDRYYRYLYRSYIESSKKRKWCPAPGCELAVAFDGGEGDSFDVTCDCGRRFCWSCGDDNHSPLDCETVAKWTEKNSSEEENTTWILAYTKPCPKCRRPIEKNNGCNLMTCKQPCGHHFCWLCLGPIGPYHRCNKYKDKDGGNAYKEDSRRLAKEHLERYTHHYERWAANDKSMKKALADLNTTRKKHVDRLIETQKQPGFQVKFVVEAWEQITECRRVLKWSYAYGYYCEQGKLDFFGHLQGEAECALERLHHCAETEMKKYLLANGPREGFDQLRRKLVGLTSVTRNYFQNFVRALENNLSEVKVGVCANLSEVKVGVCEKTEWSKIRAKKQKTK